MWNLVLDGLVEVFYKLWVHPKQEADDLAALGIPSKITNLKRQEMYTEH